MQASRKLKTMGLALTGAVVLSHCAQGPVSGGKEAVPVTEQQEIQQGAQAHKEVLARFGVLDNPALQSYVTRVGKALGARSRRPGLNWHFTVLDSPAVNAFALPGGYVYITRGILAYLNTEAELAGVLGHEIGHVVAGDALRHQSAASRARPETTLDPVLLSGLDNEPGASPLQALAASWPTGYGRARELEADRLGAEYMAKAGYKPEAMVEVIGMLKNQELFDTDQARREGREPRRYHNTFAGSPDYDARLKQKVGEADKYMVGRPREDDAELIRLMNGAYFGDSPDQGVTRHNALLHEKFGIALQFPQGWQVQTMPERVSAVSADADAIMELLPEPRNGQPLDTLQKGLKLDPGARYEMGTVSGFPAGFAAGTQQGKPVLVAAIAFNGGQFLVAGITRDGPAYQRNKEVIKAAINSFHALTPAERQQARPRVISVITAQPGMSIAGLAAHSPLGPCAETYLRMMNNLYPGGEPSAGQLLKVVN